MERCRTAVLNIVCSALVGDCGKAKHALIAQGLSCHRLPRWSDEWSSDYTAVKHRSSPLTSIIRNTASWHKGLNGDLSWSPDSKDYDYLSSCQSTKKRKAQLPGKFLA